MYQAVSRPSHAPSQILLQNFRQIQPSKLFFNRHNACQQIRIQHNSTELSNSLPPAHAQTSSVPTICNTTIAARLHQPSRRSITVQQDTVYAVPTPNPPTRNIWCLTTPLPPLHLPTSHSGHPDLIPGQISGGQSGNDKGVTSFPLTAPSTIAPYSTSALYSYHKDKRAKSYTL